MRRAGMSHRVRAAYDRLSLWADGWGGPGGSDQAPGSGSGPKRGPNGPGFGPKAGPIDYAKKLNEFNAGPIGPIGPIGSAGHGGEHAAPSRVAPRAEKHSPGGGETGFSRTDPGFRLDRLDQASNGAGFPPPRAEDHAGPIGPKPPQPDRAALPRGDICRYCGELMGWPRPVGVAFADGTAAHHACYQAGGNRGP